MDPTVADHRANGVDPAVALQVAHDTASALLHRIREASDRAVIARVLAYTTEHGVAELAELWSHAPAQSLPGALWRLYVVHASIVNDETFAAAAYDTGLSIGSTADAVVAGAPQPTSPADIRQLADDILQGAFTGDIGDAFDRAAAYCRLESRGITDIVGRSELGNSDLLNRALTLADFAADLAACARLDRIGKLS